MKKTQAAQTDLDSQDGPGSRPETQFSAEMEKQYFVYGSMVLFHLYFALASYVYMSNKENSRHVCD